MKVDIKNRVDGKVIMITHENGNVIYVRAFDNETVQINYADHSIQLQCSVSNEVAILPR